MAERVKGPEPIPSHMSLRAYKLAGDKLGLRNDELIAEQESLGAKGGTSEWHENFELEQAFQKIDRLNITIATWGPALQSPEIILPRMNVDDVQLGNRIRIKLSDSGVPEEYNMLGPADAILFPGTAISNLSSLGKAIIGGKEGDCRDFVGPMSDKLSVTILKILPGDF